jgi:cob(I)alamin adenosyltransferase
MSWASLVADIQVISVEGSLDVAKLDPFAAAPEERSGSAAANVARAAVRRNPRRSEAAEDEERGRDFMAMSSRGRVR